MADKKGFDLAGMLKDVSKLGTAPGAGREQIEYIDITLLDGDPRNRKNLRGLEELASNIELLGLRQPLRVRANPEAPGRFIIVSGHRRRAALQKLVDDGRTEFAQVPCVQDSPASSSALQELRLIFDNMDNQPYTDAEKAKLAEKVEMLLYQLKEEGFEFPGRMRDHVAQACKISAPKLSRLKVIREKLIPEYMALFEQDRMPEQSAYAMARLPEDFQKRMFSALDGVSVPRGDTVEKVLKKYNEGWRWEPQLTCPDGKACKRGDTFLRRDCEAGTWQSFCGGNTCCLECDAAKRDWSPCERMCSKAKAKRKEANDKKKEEEHKRQQKTGRKYQKETQVYAKRLLRAIDAAKLPEDTAISWGYAGHYLVADIRKWAAGEFGDPADWGYEARLKPERCHDAVKTAQLLGCSTDFLLGLTEAIQPPAVQAEPEPEELPEELAEVVEEADSWDELAEALCQAAEPEEPVRRIRWENRGRTPPEGQLILTYQMTNDGPEYRPAVWDGSKFQAPNHRKELTGLQYTHWLEVPPPGRGEVFDVAPAELPESQIVFCSWMPGGTFPATPGDVVADFQIGENTEIRQVCYYDGGTYYFKRNGAKIDAEVVRWMWLPQPE